MKKRIQTFSIVLMMMISGITTIFLLSSCERSSAIEEESGDGGIVFALSLPPEISVSTRAGNETEVINVVSNVRVLQFNTQGVLIANGYYNKDDTWKREGNGALLVVPTTEFSAVESTFYVIVNFGKEQTLESFVQKSEAQKTELEGMIFNYGSSNYKSESNRLVSDAISFDGVESGGKAKILAPLNYAYAWIEVNWMNKVPSPAHFTLQTITAYNLPTTISLLTRAGADSGVYPASGITGTSILGSDTSGLAEGTSFALFIPENLRGIGCGTSFQEKNIAGYGPKADGTAPGFGNDGKPMGGSLDGCTYIDLEGSYWYNYNVTDPQTNCISVRYRLYLGANLINDYNIRRGHHYVITVQISGANSGDVRVTITNGNVVVFDDVDTISKTVDFR